MNDVTMLLLGVALGAAPSAMVGRIMAAYLAKKAGVEPREIAAYAEASDGDTQTDVDGTEGEAQPDA